jgi:hypothetical protein
MFINIARANIEAIHRRKRRKLVLHRNLFLCSKCNPVDLPAENGMSPNAAIKRCDRNEMRLVQLLNPEKIQS